MVSIYKIKSNTNFQIYFLNTLANKKSGNNDGALIISHFRRLLNPIQVYDVIDCPPEKALDWLKTSQLESVFVLVAGGDGTVAGVLNSIHNLQLKVIINPPLFDITMIQILIIK